MIDHLPHVENARRALSAFDRAPTGSEIGRLGVKVASALRVLLYEPPDGHQGDYIEQSYLEPLSLCPKCGSATKLNARGFLSDHNAPPNKDGYITRCGNRHSLTAKRETS